MATTKVTTNLIDMSGNTGGLVWAKGTTAQRPGAPVSGDLRLNTDDSRLEFYNGTDWKRLSEQTPSVTIEVEFLVLAGGGGGGCANGAGGGGAGGLRTSFGTTSGGGGGAESYLPLSPSTNYTVTVGAGGASNYGAGAGATGSNGADSVFATVTSAGGGQG